MSVHLRPEEIESQSFAMIDAEVGDHPWSAVQWPVVRRVIHTSADFEYARSMVFSSTAIAAGVAALQNGCGIVTDTKHHVTARACAARRDAADDVLLVHIGNRDSQPGASISISAARNLRAVLSRTALTYLCPCSAL